MMVNNIHACLRLIGWLSNLVPTLVMFGREKKIGDVSSRRERKYQGWIKNQATN